MMKNWLIFDIAHTAPPPPTTGGGIFLRDYNNNATGPLCGDITGSNNSSFIFAWGGDQAAGSFYLEEVVTEAISEVDVDAVFFDETDWCGWDGCVAGFMLPG